MRRKSRETDPASDSERAAAQSFKDRVQEYNKILRIYGSGAADEYARKALYESRTEYRRARG
jgi:hypothetical protein